MIIFIIIPIIKSAYDELCSLLAQLGPPPELQPKGKSQNVTGKLNATNQLFLDFMQRNEKVSFFLLFFFSFFFFFFFFFLFSIFFFPSFSFFF